MPGAHGCTALKPVVGQKLPIVHASGEARPGVQNERTGHATAVRDTDDWGHV